MPLCRRLLWDCTHWLYNILALTSNISRGLTKKASDTPWERTLAYFDKPVIVGPSSWHLSTQKSGFRVDLLKRTQHTYHMMSDAMMVFCINFIVRHGQKHFWIPGKISWLLWMRRHGLGRHGGWTPRFKENRIRWVWSSVADLYRYPRCYLGSVSYFQDCCAT